MKCTMHRWHFAFGSMELTVDTSPAQRSPTTNPTPLKPRSIMLRTNCSQLALSSFMLSVTPITSRWPSRSIPMATSTLTFSTCPPRERLRHKPSTNTHGHSPPQRAFPHPSIPAHTCSSLSEGVCEGMRPPHGSRPVPSTRRVDTPAGHISVSASSTPDPRRRWRSITADPDGAPLGSGTLGPGLPAPAVGPRPQRPARNAFRPVSRSYPAASVISSTRSVGHRVEDLRYLFGDQPVEPGPGQVLVDLYDVRGSWFRLLASKRFLFWRIKIAHRTRAVPSYVRAGIRKCVRIRALSKIPNHYSTHFVAIP